MSKLSLQYKASRIRRSLPNDGYTVLRDDIAPNETTVTVPGSFNPEKKYMFRLVVYEGGISVPSIGITYVYVLAQGKIAFYIDLTT